jgi:hypothetical protein
MQVHELERRALPEFFVAGGAAGAWGAGERGYVGMRDAMVELYRDCPDKVIYIYIYIF